MKKLLGIFLIIALLLSNVAFCFAETNTSDKELTAKEMFEIAIADAAKASTYNMASKEVATPAVQLTNSAGTVYNVETFKYNDGNDKSVTYVYSTAPQYLTLVEEPSAGSARSIPVSIGPKPDAGDTTYGYLTITYDEKYYTPTRMQYLLETVEGRWEVIDPNFRIIEREVVYACSSSFNSSQVVSRTPASNSFAYNTNFTQYAIDDPVSAVVAAQSIAKIVRTSNPWELKVEIKLIQNTLLEDAIV